MISPRLRLLCGIRPCPVARTSIEDAPNDSKGADGQRIAGVLAHHRRWKRDRGLAHQKHGVQPHHGVVGMASKSQNMVVVEPKFADDDEADQPAQEFWQQFKQLVGQLAHARMVLERRHLKLEHQECHDNHKHPVAERLAQSAQRIACDRVSIRTNATVPRCVCRVATLNQSHPASMTFLPWAPRRARPRASAHPAWTGSSGNGAIGHAVQRPDTPRTHEPGMHPPG
jgi:hypothetical protein